MLEWLIPNNILCHAVEAMFFASIGCAVLSVIITQMKISSIGFTMAHAAFAGSAIGIFLGVDATIAAVVSSIVLALIIGPLSEKTRMPPDTTLGILFGSMMAVAIFFVSWMQNQGRGYGTSALLFGSVTALYREEIYALAAVSIISMIFVLLFFKEISAILFHQKLALISGIRVQPLYYGILFLIAVMVALILPIVGGLLLYVWLVTPAAIVYQYCSTLRQMFVAAPIVAACISITGAYAGITYSLPVGPLTAVLFSAIFLISVGLSPKRKISDRNS